MKPRRGASANLTTDELEQARLLDRIDDILNTARAQGRSLTATELAEHNTLVAQWETGNLRNGTNRNGRQLAPPTPAINGRDGFDARRSLDGLLWATADTVRAGSMSQDGRFTPSLMGATAQVEPFTVRGESLTLVAPRITDFHADEHQAIRQFQDLVSEMVIFGLLVDKQAMNSANGFEVARNHRLYADQWKWIMNALDVDTAGEGAEWVPTGIGGSMVERVRASGKIAPLFTRLDLPTNPWKWPIEGADAVMYRVAEPTGDTTTKMSASTPGTAAATFDAEIFGGRVLFSRSLEADSAMAIAPFVRGKLVRAFVEAEEKTILDGDADGTHQDADVQALGATDARTAWDGLRKKAIAQTVVTGQTATNSANILAIRAAMGKWGINPDDCAVIVGIDAYYDLLGDSNLLTNDKLGPNATILNGQLGSIYGMPVIVSEHVRQNLNATGVHDGITTTKTYNMIVNRTQWVMGQRMTLDVEIDDSIYRETYQRVAIAFAREDFAHVGDAATNDDTALAYNITP